MRFPSRRRWLSTLLLSLAVVGCGDDPPAGNTACTPACRDGFVCAAGSCVSACNPPCGASETCVTSGGRSSCVSGSDAGGSPLDTGTSGGTDGGTPGTDTGVTPPVDTGVTPTGDAGPAGDGATMAPCGMPGQPCCNLRGCFAGGQCREMMCVAPTREMDECSRPEDCSMGRVCGGVFDCMMGRGCYRCGAAPGRAALGERCTTGQDCATGLCASGRCTIACVLGPSTDGACAMAGANYFCGPSYYTPAANAPTTTIGVCRQRCARNGDCPTGTACVPVLNGLTDRMDFYCAPTTRTAGPGTSCDPNGMAVCQSALCLPAGMNTGYCTAPCVTNADCATGAPTCGTVFLNTPSGRSQESRGCVR